MTRKGFFARAAFIAAVVLLPIALLWPLKVKRSWLPRTIAVAQGRGDWDVRSLAWSPDGTRLAVGVSRGQHISTSECYYNYMVQMWDIPQQALIKNLNLPSNALLCFSQPITFSPDGAFVIYDFNQWGQGPGIHQWNVHTGQAQAIIKGIAPYVTTSNGQVVSRAIPNINEHIKDYLDRRVKVQVVVWDTHTHRAIRRVIVRTPRGFVFQYNVFLAGYLAPPVWILSPDGQLGAILLWKDPPNTMEPEPTGALIFDTHTGAHRQIFSVPQTDGLFAVPAFSPDNRMLAVLAQDKTGRRRVELRDTTTGRTQASFATQTQGSTSNFFAPQSALSSFSPDGSQVAIALDNKTTVQLRATATGQLLRSLGGHTKTVTTLAFSPDGNTLATGSQDGTVMLWRVR